jgi:flagellar biosynthetic protein FliR
MKLLQAISFLSNHAELFLLVLFRISGLLTVAPILGAATIPVKIRAAFALVLTCAVFALVPAPAQIPDSLASLLVAGAAELLIGIAMGFALSLLFIGVEAGADLIGFQMGLGLANLVDPNTQIDTTVLSQLYVLVATLIYVLINGHLILFRALVDTFQTVPLLHARIDANVVSLLVNTLSAAFILGIRIAAPALAAIFLATLALGFISRTMPQLNILATGFPIRICLGFTLMVASFAVVGVLFEDNLIALFAQIGELFL